MISPIINTANSIIQEKLDSASLEDKKFYNPWLCDTARIIKNLSNETFRSSLLSPSGCYQLSAQKIFETTGFSVLSQFIPENQIITKTGQITIKKDFPMLFSDAKNFGIFIRESLFALVIFLLLGFILGFIFNRFIQVKFIYY